MILPNGRVVDILSPVLNEMYKWIQNEAAQPESGGYIVGYQHKSTGNVSLEAISVPGDQDIGNRIRFYIHDLKHQTFLKRASRRKSYYMGVWHTHPQSTPVPSSIDWEDWSATLTTDRTGCQYAFFIIAGTHEWRMWIGDFETKEIKEAFECPKGIDDIYIKQGGKDDGNDGNDKGFREK